MESEVDNAIETIIDFLKQTDMPFSEREELLNAFLLLNESEKEIFLSKVICPENFDIVEKFIENRSLLSILYGYLINDRYLENYKLNNDIHGYYFLFKKNLKTTNIQFSELIALIRKTAKHGTNYIGNELLFLDVKELKELTQGFYNSIYQLIDSDFLRELKKSTDSLWHLFFKLLINYVQELEKKHDANTKYNPIDIIKLIIEKYHNLFLKAVIVDCFHSSCIIYLPKTIELDIKTICSLSGYVNSCGNLIYVKNVEKAQKNMLLDNIFSYTNTLNYKSKFAVFSHEDSFDKEITSQNQFLKDFNNDINSGINDVKVYLEKYHLGDDSLLEVINELIVKSKVDNKKLYVPRIDNLQWKNDELNVDGVNSTIWFLIEHSIGEKDKTKKGNYKYYICYEQIYKNENQTHIFDENKPAWKSCTTIPHTLISAMLNITLQYTKPRKSNILVMDPFVGTGTTLIDSLKYANIDFYGFDCDILMPILIQDNINIIFNEKVINEILSNFDFDIEENTIGKIGKLIETYEIDFNSYRKGEYDIKQLDTYERDLIEKFSLESICDRLLIYLLFKTNIKNSGALAREQNPLNTTRQHKILIKKESYILKAQLLELIKVLDSSSGDNKSYEFATKQGKFSEKLLLNNNNLLAKFHDTTKKNYCVKNIMELKSNQDRKYDIIITDPPYGFNVPHKNLELAGLFNDIIDIFFDNLAENGQIIMALPEKSYSGKRSPYFTHKEIVVKNFILKAHQHEFEVINTAEILPKIDLFKAPYYWEAERALRRSIIHLRFRKK